MWSSLGIEEEVEPYEVLGPLAKLYEDGGFGLEQDHKRAAELYREVCRDNVWLSLPDAHLCLSSRRLSRLWAR